MRIFQLLRRVPLLLLLVFPFLLQQEFGSAPKGVNLRLDSSQASCIPTQKTTLKGFRSIMQTVAEAWNSGDAGKAASCFAEDAIYSAPPSFIPLLLRAVTMEGKNCMSISAANKADRCPCT